MSATLITALKAVPWAEVIAAAPAVADGAKKLWKMVRTSQDKEAQAIDAAGPVDDASATDPAQLLQRINHLESRLTELEAQMEQSAQVVRELADQNTVLIARIELNRRRLKQLAVACVVALAGLAAAAVTWLP